MPPSFFPDPLPPFNINNTVGAFEIGTLVAVFLFGATCLQVYLYFERYPKDHWLIKSLVTVVWLLELGHTIAVCHAVYTMSITWYGQPELLAVPPASLDASILLNGLIGPLEQAWFIRRLYALSKNIWLTAICCILSFARCLGSIAFASLALQRPNIIVFDFEYWWLLTCIVVLGSVNDLLLAGLLSWYLNKSKKTSIQAMSRLFDRLILWTIETSAITSFATVGMMIAFFIMPTTFIYVAVYLCLAKLYANALMASLNARKIVAHRFGEIVSLESYSNNSRNSRMTRPLSGAPLHQFGPDATNTETGTNPGVYRLERSLGPGDVNSEFPLADSKAQGKTPLINVNVQTVTN